MVLFNVFFYSMIPLAQNVQATAGGGACQKGLPHWQVEAPGVPHPAAQKP